MLGDHAAALATIGEERRRFPEARDPVNGPPIALTRATILFRAGRLAESHAEVARLMQVPFGSPAAFFFDKDPELLLVRNDPQFDALINHAPRL